jgi:hypothetical protein
MCPRLVMRTPFQSDSNYTPPFPCRLPPVQNTINTRVLLPIAPAVTAGFVRSRHIACYHHPSTTFPRHLSATPFHAGTMPAHEYKVLYLLLLYVSKYIDQSRTSRRMGRIKVTSELSYAMFEIRYPALLKKRLAPSSSVFPRTRPSSYWGLASRCQLSPE